MSSHADALRAWLGRDEGQQALADRLLSGGLDEAVLPGAEQLAFGSAGDQAPRFDVLGDLAQGHLAQCAEVLDAEEVVERSLDGAARVDLAAAQPLDERLGTEVDEDDLVGALEHRVGHGLAHARAGQLRHPVVEALEVLDVDGRVDLDSRREQVVDVLVALGMLEARDVRVGQLVDEAQLRKALQHRRQVHLLELAPPVVDRPPRHELEPLGLGDRLRPAVLLEVADDHVAARLGLGLALLEHAVGLADAGRHAEEDLEAAALAVGHQAPNRLWTTRSTSLMPMNGTINPPTP